MDTNSTVTAGISAPLRNRHSVDHGPRGKERPRIALLFDNFGPYHLARLRGAQTVLGSDRVIGLQVRATSAEYKWQASSAETSALRLETILPQHVGKRRFVRKALYVWRHLDRVNPDSVAIAGYAEPEMLTALWWCRWKKRTAVLVSESKEDDAPRYWWKEEIKRWLVSFYDSALVGGHPQSRYIKKLGMPAERIFTQINVVGNDDYHPEKTQGLANPFQKPSFLLVNRFIPKKNLSFVLECYAQYHSRIALDNGTPWELTLAGDGELRHELERHARALEVEAAVHFPGFLQQKELLPYLAHCRVFIHASLVEQWGLVVNEAMAAARPVFVSRHCGCFEDLIIEGKTGFGFDPVNHTELVDLMVRATKGKLPLNEVGEAALVHIGQFSPMTFGRTLGEAVQRGAEKSKSRGWRIQG
jgi:1,2-diacylglycerol 3-alpha-glucosyltransferase